MNDIQASLSALLKALGEGVTHSSKLPIDDTFEFEKSFPEFAKELSSVQCELVRTLKSVLDEIDESNSDSHDKDGDDNCEYDVYDAAFWERCEDACEYLLDQIENPATSSSVRDLEGTRQLLNQWGKRAHTHGSTAHSTMQSKLVDMDKPQVTYRMRPAHNSRTEPFVPPIISKPNAVVPLDLSPKEGHGLEGRFPVRGEASQRYAHSPHLVAPAFHVPHPYQVEIEQFRYLPEQLVAPPSSSFPSKIIPQHDGPLTAEWIDTPIQLEKLVQDLEDEAAHRALDASHNSNCDPSRAPLAIAIDLEAHGWRSFAGMTCLMQISYYKTTNDQDNSSNSVPSPTSSIRNYLVDTLKLQTEMHRLLPIFTNPNVVKVMHGADSDILWLQRDFGLYVVNLFDTGRAARELQLSSASYAHLLHKYVGISADKSHQLADWRQRPLPPEMMQYAIQDTHYLIDIYDRLRADLQTSERIQAVLDVSRLVCLSRYAVEPFDPEGYVVLTSMHRRRGNHNNRGSSAAARTRQDLDDAQEQVLKRLWDWRDRVAREQDESVNYVCPKSALLRMALASHQLSTTAGGGGGGLRSLQSLFNPMPSPMILQYADEILGMVQDELKKSAGPKEDPISRDIASNEESAEASGNAISSSPGRTEDADHEMRTVLLSSKSLELQPSSSSNSFGASAFLVMKKRNGGMSPVLGTEALYRQAGWVTPHEKLRALASSAAAAATTSSSSAGEDNSDPVGANRGKTRHGHGVTLHASNKHYQAGPGGDLKKAAAAIESDKVGEGKIGGTGAATSRTVDGMATVRAARGDAAPGGESTLEEELKRAKESSSAVQAKLRGALPSVLGLVTPVIDLEEDDTGIEDGRESRIRDAYGGARDDEDFVIPRSMREIYTISNRNRRNKKAGSPTPERGVTPTTEKEREELANAEALLKEHGLLPSPYFDDGTNSPGKKARTKPSSGRESEETVPQDSAAMASRDDDFAVLKSIGWLPEGASVGKSDGDQSKHATFGFDYASAGGQGGSTDAKQPPSNPFFAGAALVGGPLAQGFNKPDQRAKKPNPGRGKQQGRRQERPKKEEGRTHAYRKR